MSSDAGGKQDEGLYGKYTVLKDGEPQAATFVLKPESDPAALAAMKTYAQATDDHELAADLESWIAAIESAEGEHGLLEDCEECSWSEVWEGGSAADDPGLQHAKETGHTVHTEVKNGE